MINLVNIVTRTTLFALILLAASPAFAQDNYKLGPDSMLQQGVPQGVVTQHKWTSKKVFPGTVRDYWIYVPRQYDRKSPAAVMVFQDGGTYVNTKRSFRIPTVFDNLIHKGEMPVTIGVFLNPGVLPAAAEGAQPRRLPGRYLQRRTDPQRGSDDEAGLSLRHVRQDRPLPEVHHTFGSVPRHRSQPVPVDG